MSQLNEKRILNPKQIHQIWISLLKVLRKLYSTNSKDDIETANDQPISSFYVPFKDVCLHYEDNEQKQFDSIEYLVQQAINDGLLMHKSKHLNNTDTNTKIDSTEPEHEPDAVLIALPPELNTVTGINGMVGHDRFCFECHLGGNSLIECQLCWRVYHESCVQTAHEFAVQLDLDKKSKFIFNIKNFHCPLCVLSRKFEENSIGSRQFSQEEFNEILSFAYQRFKAKSNQISRSLLRLKDYPFPPLLLSTVITESSSTSSCATTHGMSTLNELSIKLALKYISVKAIDLTEIENKLDESEYTSISDFLGDCLTFKHMIEVVIISAFESNLHRRIHDTLNRMLDACRYEIKEMLGCIDCYQNSNMPNTERHWFCKPCDPPHVLVFAKQKGYPFWPAKVIKPRNVTKFDSFEEVDVRFFGANHERSIVHPSNIMDINSSLIRLCITKPNPSLEKALAELRVHREMLEKLEKGIDSNNSTSEEQNGDGGKVSRTFNKRLIKPSWKMAESNDGAKVKRPKSRASGVKRSRTNTTESESATTHIDSDSDKNDKSNSPNETDIEQEIQDSVERKRTNNVHRSENDDSTSTDVDENVESEIDVPLQKKTKSNGSIKRNDSDQFTGDSNKDIEVDKNVSNGEEATVKRGRGRPRKYFSNDSTIVSPSKKKEKVAAHERRIRKNKILYSPQTQNKAKKVSSDILNQTSSSTSLPVSKGRKSKIFNLFRSYKKTSAFQITGSGNRLILKNGRKRSISPLKSPKSTNVNASVVSNSSPVSKNTERARRRKQNIERQRQLILARRKQEPILPKHIPPVTATKSSPACLAPNSINKTIISSVCTPLLNKNQNLLLNQSLASPILNNQLNQSSTINHHQISNLNSISDNQAETNSISTKPESSSKSLAADQTDSCQERSEEHYSPSSVLKPLMNGDEQTIENDKYLEYSSSMIYSPTIKNRTLVNAYLHEMSNNSFPPSKNDYLAHLILRKDEPEPEPEILSPTRKRGRPPKGSTGDELLDRSGKARSIVEKSYLQESACDRACLMKNIKTFKKFRDFVETQNKEEINKCKREIEELKQEVYKLKNQKIGLEDELSRHRELSKRIDPQFVDQLQDKHRRQISEIKRKQWCVNCEAEAAYFWLVYFCFNTNYCSPECQHKHWLSEHKNNCTRNHRTTESIKND
ncbi:PWWP domain [Blomia tropicalis]|nr:PWWP domain [Blomia tropicalis]